VIEGELNMDADLKEALEALHDFRQFWIDNVTQQHMGSNHHNPMWMRVATVLDKHGMNGGPDLMGAYYRANPAYRPASRCPHHQPDYP
jgi:hypothetical protein